ncbi:MAG TPA: hypothetical protein DCS89_08705 [Gammaproteobacteria bacterium]|nr:hypothetical protein [Gammaproteobacteria bacterium]HAT27080.1 hypothetical protein [Gammaproteobacteria bacterium]HIF87272.1 hypothetical protein [Gammaproteobacteria bacterium]HIL63452.1 hypothetical protein [Porticoccaceae bacterium]|tara:strand:- start:1524 stop:2555 length:1032 start_codon:yes stop_codon:yes gene_type:complete
MKTRILAVIVLLPVAMVLATVVSAQDEFLRTPAGKPDFSGNYDIASLTPFQRPASYGERLFLSSKEVEAMRDRALSARAEGARPSNPENGAPAAGGDIGSYNDFWFDYGTDGFAIDGKFRTSVLTSPADGRMPARTAAGREKLAKAPRFAWPEREGAWWLETGDTPYDGPENMVLGVRCIYQPGASVAIRPLPYNNLKTIVQTDDYVMIMIEWMHWARVIRLDSEHKPAELSSLDGDSIGWWEGDTLVVETINFLDEPFQPNVERRVIERFSPINAGGLLYSFTVDDPDYETPYSGELVWPKTDQRSYEYACHEGNYAMASTLQGARVREKEWREENGAEGNQ